MRELGEVTLKRKCGVGVRGGEVCVGDRWRGAIKLGPISFRAALSVCDRLGRFANGGCYLLRCIDSFRSLSVQMIRF